MNPLVLMTSCIDPSAGHIKISRCDPRVRIEDYKLGLKFWLGTPFNILYIDNSGYPLDELVELASRQDKRVEFISMRENDYPSDLHYGYGELKIIDRAFEKSEALKESKYFIKATGRLTFPTITRLLNRLPKDYLFAVDSRRSLLYKTPFITTQLMIFSTAFYREHLLNASPALSKLSGYIEDALYQKLMQFDGASGAILRWPVNCSPVGYSANWIRPKRYDSPKQKGIQAARAVCRKVSPHWWV